MTVHHVIALALAVVLVGLCIVTGNKCGEHMKDILYFAGTIATATFAHAQGAKKGAAKKKKPKSEPPKEAHAA